MAALACCLSLAAQNSYDLALDKYELICDECIALREKAQKGEAVSEDQLADLLDQLRGLRSTISESEGRMSQAQRSRYHAIRNRYIAAMRGKEPLYIEEMVSPIRGEVLVRFDNKLKYREKTIPGKPEDKTEFAILAEVGGTPMSAGVMAACLRSRWGAFIKVRSNFTSAPSTYDCLSDGTTGTGFIWASGEEKRSLSSYTAGAMSPSWKGFRTYAGLGWGQYTRTLRDTKGEWARVEDLSAKGLNASGGLFFHYKRFAANIGVSNIGGKLTDFEFGLGLYF